VTRWLVALVAGVACAAASAQAPASRAQLLAQAEASLAALDTQRAELEFDRAAAMAHAADAELGLVRTYMQEGEYRRALSFVAHAAQGHLDDPGGAALYAWLLHIGGQQQPAARILAQAMQRFPHEPLLRSVHRELESPEPSAEGTLAIPPSRFAPYGAGIEAGVVVATGWVFDGGRHALVPLDALRAGKSVSVRNGLGSPARARVEKRLPGAGIAVLAIDPPLVVSGAAALAPRDPFPGSVAYAVEYARSRSGAPAWPMLRAGFVGAAVGSGSQHALDVDGARGGPVFDATGRFMGLALDAHHGGAPHLIPRSAFASLAGMPHAMASPPSASMPADALYESALRDTVQVIVPR
jgi:hypothetical protein